MRIYAAGLRNAVGIGFNSESTALSATVNERDNIGDDVPSDYFTRVIEGGFYRWPYSYIGRHLDNRVTPRPQLVAKAIVPDVLIGAHVAPLQFVFYGGHQFPVAYWGGAFIAEHGSWNRRLKRLYQVAFIPFRAGVPAGVPVPFFSGFLPAPAGKVVYGRVTGLAVAPDGCLLISDDGGNLIWRVSYEPRASGTTATEEFSDQVRVRTRGLLLPLVLFGLIGARRFLLSICRLDRMVVVCYYVRSATYIGELSNAGNTPVMMLCEKVLRIDFQPCRSRLVCS